MSIIRAQVEWLRNAAKWERQAAADDLKRRIRQAEAWGTPDQESTGMTHAKLIALLREARLRIEYLEEQQHDR